MSVDPNCRKCGGAGYYWQTVTATIEGRKYRQNLWTNCPKCNAPRAAETKRKQGKPARRAASQ